MSAGPDLQRLSWRRRPGSTTRGKTGARTLAHRPWQRLAVGGVATAGVIGFAAWKIPMGLPGHRALGWLTVLILARLIAGPGWSAIVGVLGAGAVLALGISPDGIYGVADYAIAGVLIDVTLQVRPKVAHNGLKLALLGAVVLLAVGWIAPLGQSLAGGVPLAYVWPSLVSAFGAGLSRLVVLDLTFGAVAGVMAWGLANALVSTVRRAGATALSRPRVGVTTT